MLCWLYQSKLSRLADIILNVPLGLLTLATSSYLLHLYCDCVDRRSLPLIIVQAPSGIVPLFVAMETYDKGHHARIPMFYLGWRWLPSMFISCTSIIRWCLPRVLIIPLILVRLKAAIASPSVLSVPMVLLAPVIALMLVIHESTVVRVYVRSPLSPWSRGYRGTYSSSYWSWS